MVNLGAHIIVAQRAGHESSGFMLGAALPDIASMGGFRLLGSTDDADVADGIAFHHRTDDAFHHHPWFVDVQRPLRSALLDAGLGRGASRAIAHVGPELLLDGWLIDADADLIEAAFAELSPNADALTPLVRAEHRERWNAHLRRAAAWRPGDEPHDPAAVAQRLHRILRRRPRLAFDSDRVGAVGDLLVPTNDHIGSTSADFMADLVTKLQDD